MLSSATIFSGLIGKSRMRSPPNALAMALPIAGRGLDENLGDEDTLFDKRQQRRAARKNYRILVVGDHAARILNHHGFYQVEASHGPPLLLSQSQAVSSKPWLTRRARGCYEPDH
jgi:hypothetical protein